MICACLFQITPLRLAVGLANIDVVRLLTGWGAALDVPDSRGVRPLFLAGL